MTGQLLFYSYPLYALINFGSIHCFILKGIVERLKLEPLVIPLIKIKIPDEDQVHNSLMLVEKIVFLRGYVMDMVIINMLDFDLILSMDFLNRHGAKIDWRKKKVRFSMDKGE